MTDGTQGILTLVGGCDTLAVPAAYRWELIPPTTIRKNWDDFRLKLLAVKRKGDVDWIPEDVFHEILSGISTVFFVYKNEVYHGFVVVRKDFARYSGNPYLFVFILGVQDWDDEFGENAVKFFKDVARNMGVTKARFEGRPGWLRANKNHGCRVVNVMMEGTM